MEQEIREAELGSIQTLWTVVRQAHDGPAEAVAAAQQKLLDRYGKAVKRYLLGALRDSEAADELAQEFALRFLRGDFRRADPQRGRFRDFVRGVLIHLIADHHRRQQRQPNSLPAAGVEPAAPAPDLADSDRQFLGSWRSELLDHAWKALASLQEQTGQPFYTVLRFRAEHLDLHSAPMAEQLTGLLGKPVTAVWVRQMLHRAREKFAHFLIAEVMQTLDNPTAEQVEEELVDLSLLDYCRPALDQLKRSR
jgi:RNA polymerase sigma-70 factor (ECF subfamily)